MERKNKKTAYVKSAFKLTIEVFSENEQELVDQVVPGAPPLDWPPPPSPL